MTAHIYVLKPEGMNIGKVGMTTDLKCRVQSLRNASPIPLNFYRVLDVGSGWFAKIKEWELLNWSRGLLEYGEWVRLGDDLDDLLESIAPAVDVTDEWCARPKRSTTRRIRTQEYFDFMVACELASRVPGGYRKMLSAGIRANSLNSLLGDSDVPEEFWSCINEILSAQPDALAADGRDNAA